MTAFEMTQKAEEKMKALGLNPKNKKHRRNAGIHLIARLEAVVTDRWGNACPITKVMLWGFPEEAETLDTNIWTLEGDK